MKQSDCMMLGTQSFWPAVLVAMAVFMIGCGKKEPEAPPPAPSPEAAAPVAQPAQPAVQATPTTVAPDARLAESKAALQAREYDKAAATLIALQRSHLSQQQAAATAAQMRQLQSSLADAVASGDPNAKAAADRLRQAAMVR